MKIDYQKELNPAQYDAVTRKEGAFLLIAGAGSGKTRTLVYRVARLVDSDVAPESILLLTFTRKASMEMMVRASSLLDDRCSRISGGTFHSVGNLMLRRYGSKIGIDSGFTIMDVSDARDLINLLKNERGYGKQNKSFPRKATLMDIFSLSVNKRLPMEMIVADSHPHLLDFLDQMEGLKTAYSRYKKAHGLMDYDDLLVMFKELLEAPEVRERVRDRYKFVMVDEYQDTNLLQGEIVALLGSDVKNVMAVGDPAQSIYSFRGANFENILQFEKFFPGLKVIKLEENYRSTQKVLDVCNAIMSPAKEKYGKRLFTRGKTGKDQPVIVENETPTEEAIFIADKVEEIAVNYSIPLNEIAVLFRNSFHVYELEMELNRRGLSFIKFGGFKFVETAHVKDVLSFLRVMANPRDTVSWSRLLQLMEGMGPKTAMKTIKKIQGSEGGVSFSKLEGMGKFSQQFKELEKLFRAMASKTARPADTIEKILDYYYPVLEQKYDDHPKRKKDLEQFLSITGKYNELGHLLTDMSLEPPNASKAGGKPADPKGASGDYLVLSTVHSAKGLEWDTVFVMAANEGSFPNSYVMENEEGMEEERRLFYVAATRAKERLFFTFSSRKKNKEGRYYPVSPSPFLNPIMGNGLVKEMGWRRRSLDFLDFDS